jgi:pimeloyl-ACP methyl ester carboxylesterase
VKESKSTSPCRTDGELSRPVVAAIIALILVTGCVKPVPAVTSEPGAVVSEETSYVPTFAHAECQFDAPPGYEIECGYLSVPESRDQPDTRMIRLHVAVFKSTSPSPAPDPLIHLVGGPGGDRLGSSGPHMKACGDGILESRDYVLFSQRGTHYAEPSLECPGHVAFGWELVAQRLSRAEREAREIEFLLGCHDALLERGVDLSAYNSAASAADVNDLRVALGYERVSLYGGSYGTQLALTVMRDYPHGIRSVILDSVAPLHVDPLSSLAPRANQAFEVLFEGCAADEVCSERYPDLREVFYRVVDDLDASPVTVPVREGTIAAWVDGGAFMSAIFGTMYRSDAIPWLPLMIDQVSQGNYDPIVYPLEVMYDKSYISWGMHYSVECREEVPFTSYADSLTRAADLPAQVVDHFASQFDHVLCESWESGQADPVENEPVISDIPTLVLSGQYDPVTPPEWGRLAAETLDNSFFFELPGIGHGAMCSNECGLELSLQFLDDPTTAPDASCIGDLPSPVFE